MKNREPEKLLGLPIIQLSLQPVGSWNLRFMTFSPTHLSDAATLSTRSLSLARSHPSLGSSVSFSALIEVAASLFICNCCMKSLLRQFPSNWVSNSFYVPYNLTRVLYDHVLYSHFDYRIEHSIPNFILSDCHFNVWTAWCLCDSS